MTLPFTSEDEAHEIVASRVVEIGGDVGSSISETNALINERLATSAEFLAASEQGLSIQIFTIVVLGDDADTPSSAGMAPMWKWAKHQSI